MLHSLKTHVDTEQLAALFASISLDIPTYIVPDTSFFDVLSVARRGQLVIITGSRTMLFFSLFA